jgi:hypothetical protein
MSFTVHNIRLRDAQAFGDAADQAGGGDASVAALLASLQHIRLRVASKLDEAVLQPPETSRVGQVCQMKPNAVTGIPEVVWDYLTEFHYLASDGLRWKLYVQDGNLKTERTVSP